MQLSEILTARGFVHQYSTKTLGEITDGDARVVYLGVDPTADSIHVGNLAGFMMLRHFVEHGHRIVLLIGGGTGMIGDPKPDVERPLTPPEEVAGRAEKIKKQAQRLFGGVEVEVVNNHDWLSKLDLISFLRDIGKHFTVNALMKKDAIAARLKSEEGISYTEFAYPLLQAYDFWHLFKEKSCTVQIGGSDQWGNITAGVELIRRKENAAAFALTLPLIVDKSGKKFGKSEGNAVWLDATKTTPFAFYQFWLQVDDDQVEALLKQFTLLSLSDIEHMIAEHVKDPGKRAAQKALAHAVTELVHGKPEADAIARASEILYSTDTIQVTPVEREVLLAQAPKTHVAEGDSIVDVLVAVGFATSKREAREFLDNGSVTLQGKKIGSEYVLTDKDFVEEFAILRRGKRNSCLLTTVL